MAWQHGWRCTACRRWRYTNPPRPACTPARLQFRPYLVTAQQQLYTFITECGYSNGTEFFKAAAEGRLTKDCELGVSWGRGH